MKLPESMNVVVVSAGADFHGDVFPADTLREVAETRSDFWFDEDRQALMCCVSLSSDISIQSLPADPNAMVCLSENQ